METLGKEEIIKRILGISGWVERRGTYCFNRDEDNFKRADIVVDYLVERLREYIKNEST